MKPSIPSGTRDFSPSEVAKRNYIFSVLKNTFERYGYQPIETPAMENLETLTGKYGEEGEKLIYRVVDSGNYFEKLVEEFGTEIIYQTSGTISLHISEKALRYDLTVPFARYVVQHQHEITFPFKRYQMQSVWRADRPQKGRYREFFQCDVDVIGSNSLLNEVELIQIIDDVFRTLLIKPFWTVKINNRKILSGIAEVLKMTDKISEITVAIDKIEQIGADKVIDELKSQDIINEENIGFFREYLKPYLSAQMKYEDKIKFLKNIVSLSETGKKGVEEIESVFNHLSQLNIAAELDYTLARGLNYYTGTIIEVKPEGVSLKTSICGGGRYDNLTGIFGLPGVSGVGVSFGIDRIYDIMNELNLFENSSGASLNTKVMFVNFGEKEEMYCLPLLAKVRAAGINAEMYPDRAKIKKQFEYAGKKQIPYVAVIGTDEMQNGNITVKNMSTSEQEKITMDELIEKLK